MRQKVFKIFAGLAVIVVCVIIGQKIQGDNKLRDNLMEQIEMGNDITLYVEDHLDWLMVEKLLQQHNNESMDEDQYFAYQIDDNNYWLSSEKAYNKILASLRENLIDCSFAIERREIAKVTMSFVYATEEQKIGYESSILLWKDLIEEKANIQIVEEQKGEITIVTVILTSEDFVEGEVPKMVPSSFFSCNLLEYLLQ